MENLTLLITFWQYVMACVYLSVSDMIRYHTEKTNRIQHFLRVTPNIVFTHYQEKRKEGADWYSPSYYTHLHGYKMDVNVWLKPSHNYLNVYSYLLLQLLQRTCRCFRCHCYSLGHLCKQVKVI